MVFCELLLVFHIINQLYYSTLEFFFTSVSTKAMSWKLFIKYTLEAYILNETI